ncbi:MAG: PilZ domain-containing protein [Thermodesulfobacteriota bacterium]
MRQERRSTPRTPAGSRLCVVCRPDGSDAVSATLDLSDLGMGLNLVTPADFAPAPGEEVLVDLVPRLSGTGLLRVPGRVAWRLGDRLGVEFSEPLPALDPSGPGAPPSGLAKSAGHT